jgi:hypothetical protein
MCLIGNVLYDSILCSAEDALLASDAREQFLDTRDTVLEKQAAIQMRRVLGPACVIYEGVSEFPNAEPVNEFETPGGWGLLSDVG